MPRKRKVPTPGAPTDPRGGPRTGTPGRAYPNRTDMTAQPVRTAPGQQYGQRSAQAAAQSAVPMAGGPGAPGGPAPGGPGTSGVAAGAPQGPMPGQLGDLLGPSARPDEPITAGLPVGPGAGPGVLPPPMNPGSDVLPQLQALYAAFPTEQLREIIEDIEIGEG